MLKENMKVKLICKTYMMFFALRSECDCLDEQNRKALYARKGRYENIEVTSPRDNLRSIFICKH